MDQSPDRAPLPTDRPEPSHPTVVPIRRPAEPGDVAEHDPGGIGSASRSCLAVLVLATAAILLVCASWVIRLLFL